MKISCPYCGRIHDRSYECPQRRKIYPRRDDPVSRFRSTKAWARKSAAIRERDDYLCQVCLRNMYGTDDGTQIQYNTENLSVHHIVPLETDFDKRLDDDNLITLCGRHHAMAERGEIPTDVLRRIAAEQNSKTFAT